MQSFRAKFVAFINRLRVARAELKNRIVYFDGGVRHKKPLTTGLTSYYLTGANDGQDVSFTGVAFGIFDDLGSRSYRNGNWTEFNLYKTSEGERLIFQTNYKSSEVMKHSALIAASSDDDLVKILGHTPLTRALYDFLEIPHVLQL